MIDTSITGRRYLITGGGGFLGSHLVRRLISLGARVSVVNHSTVSPWRLADIKGYFTLHHADVTDVKRLTEAMDAVRPDGIFHLAAYGVDSADQDIRRAIDVNVLGLINVIDAMRHCGCTRLVAMGSGAEYGIHEGPISEDDPLQPQSVYASSKAAATVVAHPYARRHGVGIVTLRPFGIYGEAEPRHKLFCETILTLLDGNPLNLTPGGQCRDYCHVADITTALVMSMTDSSLTDEVFNVGTGELRSLREYVEHIRALIDPAGEVHFGALPYRRDEVFAPAPDTRHIREKLGWRPLIDLDQGLERTVTWFRANRQLYQ